MFETFRNAWKIEDLRKRLLFTLLILILFRSGCALLCLTSPAVHWTSCSPTGSMLEYLNL